MKLCAYRCENCGKLIHPAPLVCDRCGGRAFAEEPLSGRVRLLTFTRVHNLPAGIDKPFLDFGIVEFANGVRVTGQLALYGEGRIGMELETGVGTVRVVDGEEKQGFIFGEA